MAGSEDQEPIVWIANIAGHDYSDAKRFGEPKPLTLGDVNPIQVDRLAWHLARGIGKFAREEDFLLISGTPTVNALALTMWLTRFESVQLLQFNAKTRKYVLATIERGHLGRLIDNAMV